MPDPEVLPELHYKSYKSTPVTNEDATPREVDDFQPRVQLKELFSKQCISSEDTEKIHEFSTKYALEEKHVRAYLLHLEDLKFRKEKRSEKARCQREKTKEKTYRDYNWMQMLEENRLEMLKVEELNKYLAHHNLCGGSTKKQNLVKIISHLQQQDQEEEPEEEQTEQVEGEEEGATESLRSRKRKS